MGPGTKLAKGFSFLGPGIKLAKGFSFLGPGIILAKGFSFLGPGTKLTFFWWNRHKNTMELARNQNWYPFGGIVDKRTVELARN